MAPTRQHGPIDYTDQGYIYALKDLGRQVGMICMIYMICPRCERIYDWPKAYDPVIYNSRYILLSNSYRYCVRIPTTLLCGWVVSVEEPRQSQKTNGYNNCHPCHRSTRPLPHCHRLKQASEVCSQEPKARPQVFPARTAVSRFA